MDFAAREFLFRLLKTPSPSGYEQPIQQVVREYLAGCADSVTTDSHGNVMPDKPQWLAPSTAGAGAGS